MFSHEIIPETKVVNKKIPPEIINFEFKRKIKFAFGSAFNIYPFAIIVTDNGEVYLKGNIGTYDYVNFTKLTNVSNIKFAGCGENFIILIDENNKVYGCGSDYGQFGANCGVMEDSVDSIGIDEFQKFMTIKENIKFITCGSDFVIIVTKENSILFGGNSDVINGTVESIKGYKLIENTPRVDIKHIKVGYYHTILLDSFGNIYGSGKNNNGQLGFENSTTHLENFTKLNTPCKVKAIHCTTNGTLILSYNNEMYKCGFDSNIRGFLKVNLFENNIIHSLKFIMSDYYLTIILVNNEIYSIFFLDESVKLSKGFMFEKNWPYKNVCACDNTTFYIGSNYKMNKIIINKNKIYERLYLQILNKENIFLDIIVCCNDFNYKKRKIID
ncbi:hypothetical protein ABK040_008956 [Willaertia magna]